MDITWLGENSFKINDEMIDVLVNPNTKKKNTVVLEGLSDFFA